MNGSQQLEVLKAAAAHPQHPLYTLHSRYQSRKDASDAMIKAQIGLKQKLEECDTQLAQYKVSSFTTLVRYFPNKHIFNRYV